MAGRLQHEILKKLLKLVQSRKVVLQNLNFPGLFLCVCVCVCVCVCCCYGQGIDNKLDWRGVDMWFDIPKT